MNPLQTVLGAAGVAAILSFAALSGGCVPDGGNGSGSPGTPPGNPDQSQEDSANPDAVWVARSQDVLKLRSDDGELLLELDKPGARSVATDPRRGVLWAWTRRGLIAWEPDGEQHTTVRLPGVPGTEGDHHPGSGPDDDGLGGSARARLAVDTTGAVWIARGGTLTRVNREGSVQGQQDLNGSVAALALDSDRDRLWIAQSETLVAIAADGSPAERVELDDETESAPRALAYAPESDALWVAGDQQLLRLGPEGEVRYREEVRGRTAHLAADGRGGVWLAGRQRLRHVDGSGLTRFELRP
ncbi:hypothetical protein, partial [Thiohalospira sp.]|uniref:hypothetical protein n=1 Tax=Thiohalospira sp. TaxID=3080549 RepID=UPI00397F42D9